MSAKSTSQVHFDDMNVGSREGGGAAARRPNRREASGSASTVTVKIRFAVSPGTRQFDAAELEAFAVASEAIGFDSIWLSDVPLSPIGDPLLTLAYAAARTSRLKLGLNLVPIGRNPMLVARQLAQLDRLSGGRVLVTLVPGLGQPGERAALGFPTGDRGALIEEIIGLLRRWWAGEAVDHHRNGFAYEGVRVEPTPHQQPLEIWLGGTGPKALERVGRCGDGWLTATITPSEAAQGRATILAAADANERAVDVEHFGISIPYARREVPATALAVLRQRRSDGDLAGIVPVGAEQLGELIGQHVEAGLSKFVLRPLDPRSIDADLAWLADVVLPLQT